MVSWHFARQAHTVKTTLTLPMLCWKIGLDMPQLADVALPRGSSICIMFCALATHAGPCRSRFHWPPCERCSFVCVLRKLNTRVLHNILPATSCQLIGVACGGVAEEGPGPKPIPFLEWRGVERAEDQQLPTALHTGDCNVNREWVSPLGRYKDRSSRLL